jgi:inner membrane protein
MVLHRAETHAPFWLTLFSLPLRLRWWRLQRQWAQWRRWWLAMWLALVTHPLLDALTVYGTQLACPSANHPFGVGSVFIIDPLVHAAAAAGRQRPGRWPRAAPAAAWRPTRRPGAEHGLPGLGRGRSSR